MNRCLSALVALLCALLLAHCGDASTNRCDATANPQLECGPNDACVWVDDEGSACLPKCESSSDCADHESCLPRPHRTSNTELVSLQVCFDQSPIEWPETTSQQDMLSALCRSRKLEVCERDPRCRLEHAAKLNVDERCGEATPVGCIYKLDLCTLSFFVATNAADELFVFAMGCGNESFAGLNLEPDDPLHRLLFEGETAASEWHDCD